jgi:hypothetical protein
MGYLIAAYAVVIGSLVAYGLWIQAQRRALRRRAAERPGGEAEGASGPRRASAGPR